MVEFTLLIRTKFRDGGPFQLAVRFHGTSADSAFVPLNSASSLRSNNPADLFLPGQDDEFRFTIDAYIGEIRWVELLRLDASPNDPSEWHIAFLRIRDREDLKEFWLPFNGPLDTSAKVEVAKVIDLAAGVSPDMRFSSNYGSSYPMQGSFQPTSSSPYPMQGSFHPNPYASPSQASVARPSSVYSIGSRPQNDLMSSSSAMPGFSAPPPNFRSRAPSFSSAQQLQQSVHSDSKEMVSLFNRTGQVRIVDDERLASRVDSRSSSPMSPYSNGAPTVIRNPAYATVNTYQTEAPPNTSAVYRTQAPRTSVANAASQRPYSFSSSSYASSNASSATFASAAPLATTSVRGVQSVSTASTSSVVSLGGRPESGDLVAGPLLGFRGQEDNRWRFSALVITADKVRGKTRPRMTYALSSFPRRKYSVKAERVAVFRQEDKYRVWRYQWDVPQLDDREHGCIYRIGRAATCGFVIPGARQLPRIISCSGMATGGATSSLPGLPSGVSTDHLLWRAIKKILETTPVHLLVNGGAVICGEGLWEFSASLREWKAAAPADRSIAERPFQDNMRREAAAFYFREYVRELSRPDRAWVLARIPTISIWDERDLFHGYCSLPRPVLECSVIGGLRSIARDFAWIFQHHRDQVGLLAHQPTSAPNQSGVPFTSYIRCGSLAFLLLDVILERNDDLVVSEKTFGLVHSLLTAMPTTVRHLFVVSPAPVSFLKPTPTSTNPDGNPDAEMSGTWASNAKTAATRARLLEHLFNFADQRNARVVVLSGHVRIAAAIEISSSKHTSKIFQIISSAIDSPPPPRDKERALLQRLGPPHSVSRDLRFDPDGVAEVAMAFDHADLRLLWRENLCLLEADELSDIYSGSWYVRPLNAEHEVPYYRIALGDTLAIS